MESISLRPELTVYVSAIWQTTSTRVRCGETTLVIDSVVLPEELADVASAINRGAMGDVAIAITHGDWDHVLAPTVFPDAPVHTGASTCSRLAATPEETAAALRSFDEQWYILREPFALPALTAHPLPGSWQIAEQTIELHPTPGHTADGCAYHLPWLKTLVCGDYLSSVEIPMLNASGSIEDYVATLRRLGALLGAVETVIPGHGPPVCVGRAREILAEDTIYAEALLADPADATPPPSRTNPHQLTIHAANLTQLERTRTVP
ncbi:MBL fold metallo-hydrolase [Conexibacter sp. DBS9H8]|uniref:MBL fold metallo-hydrolase n=1 Tax=Conexibacter sp. DBS9H8 TaxID=2937801 RepID=UPI00200CFBEF|nr:MBL fold metallo-hydrolase [Conexibacter sp. DBS9H8]